MLKEWMNTPWAQEAHQASLNSLIEAARSGEQVHPAFASMAVELDEIDRVLLDQLREQRIAVLDCCLSRMTRDKTFAGRKEAEHGTEIPLVSHMTMIMPQDGDYEHVQAALDNLQRMNLIAVRMQTESKAPADVANNIYEVSICCLSRLLSAQGSKLCSSIRSTKSAAFACMREKSR